LNFERGAVEVPTTQQAVEVLINTIAYQHYLLSAASAGVIFYSRDSTAFTSAVAAEEGFFSKEGFFSNGRCSQQ